MENKEKKYVGYGYHGGGRKKSDVEAKRCTMSISGMPSEINAIKQVAKRSGKSVSRYVIDLVLRKESESSYYVIDDNLMAAEKDSKKIE